MLYGAMPPVSQWGGRNHIALEVPDIAKATAVLKARAAQVGYGKDLAVKVGVNGKRQMNMFDPDGTRVELMEPFTADGKPVLPSTAPPPVPVRD
jgi:lactoylglutathione lyase